MSISLFTQKNICAALGFLMALTIVLKANQESKLAKQTARFEYTKPTSEIGTISSLQPLYQQMQQKNKSYKAYEFCLVRT
jgi:hypothetical protein